MTKARMATVWVAGMLTIWAVPPAAAQDGTRAGEIAAAQAEKAKDAEPYRAPFVEHAVQELDDYLSARHMKWHPFFGIAYPGAGLTLGAGYLLPTGDHSTLDLRAAMSLNKSKVAELEYRVPRLLRRRASFRLLGGWAEGLGQNFYGVGSTGATTDDRTRFDFRQASGSAQMEFRPERGPLVVGATVGASRYEQRGGNDDFESRYDGSPLPGVGETVNYVTTQGRLGLDWRPARGYAQRGGAIGVTAQRAFDLDGGHAFNQVDYDVVQHLPVMREAWVLSVHGRAETTYTADGDEVPFFMLPTLGNADTLRAFANQRFRDRNSLLLSAEWRILLNHVVDAAFFYDAGKVTARTADLDFHGLKRSYGFGLRLHTLASTPFRVDVARGNEGTRLMFSGSAAF